jgi:transcriptional regulator with XRE-family HTH domain
MPYKQQSTASPLKRIRTARGLTMQELSVYAGVSYRIIQVIDRLEPKDISRLTLGKLMRVAMLLECAPVELVPFLKSTVKGEFRKAGKEKRDRKNKSLKPRQRLPSGY